MKKYVDMDTLKFMLYDVHQLEELLERDRFEDHDKESLDLFLESTKDFGDKELFPFVKEMDETDLGFFIELMSEPEIIEPIPQPKWTLAEIQSKFKDFRNYSSAPLTKEKVIWGVYEKDKNELIGLCAFLKHKNIMEIYSF